MWQCSESRGRKSGISKGGTESTNLFIFEFSRLFWYSELELISAWRGGNSPELVGGNSGSPPELVRGWTEQHQNTQCFLRKEYVPLEMYESAYIQGKGQVPFSRCKALRCPTYPASSRNSFKRTFSRSWAAALGAVVAEGCWQVDWIQANR